MLELIGLGAAGAAGLFGHVKSKNWVSRKLRYTKHRREAGHRARAGRRRRDRRRRRLRCRSSRCCRRSSWVPGSAPAWRWEPRRRGGSRPHRPAGQAGFAGNRPLAQPGSLPVNYDKRTVKSWDSLRLRQFHLPGGRHDGGLPASSTSTSSSPTRGDVGSCGGAWAVSLSALLVAFTSPLLGAIADRSGSPQEVLRRLRRGVPHRRGADDDAPARNGHRGLPLLRHRQRRLRERGRLLQRLPSGHRAARTARDEVSGNGFGWGYLGSALGLLLVLPFGMREQYELIWPIVAVFFLLFAIPAFPGPAGGRPWADAGRPGRASTGSGG